MSGSSAVFFTISCTQERVSLLHAIFLLPWGESVADVKTTLHRRLQQSRSLDNGTELSIFLNKWFNPLRESPITVRKFFHKISRPVKLFFLNNFIKCFIFPWKRHFDDVTPTSLIRNGVQIRLSVVLNVNMNCARDYENVLNFVKVMPKILLVPFIFRQDVYTAPVPYLAYGWRPSR